MKRLKKSLAFITTISMLATLSACNSDNKDSSKEETATEATTEAVTEEATETPTEAPTTSVYTGSAYNIYAYFKENCENIGKYIEYSKDTDPNKLLGTENSYLQKLNFSLTNLPENTLIYPDLGVSIEIFENNSNAESRKKEFTDSTEASIFACDNVLLRITIESDTKTVTSLQESLTEFMQNPKEYIDNQLNLQKDEVHPFSDPENYKSECQDTSYSEIARDSNGLAGQYFTFTGKIIQVMDGTYRMNVTVDEWGIYNDTILFIYDTGDGDRILEDDIVTIWGQSMGLTTYTSVLGSEITVPAIDAKYISINNTGE